MIVKTGANYQAEGGYIEASKTGSSITIKTGDDNYGIKSDADVIDSLYKTLVSIDPEISGTLYCSGLTKVNNVIYPVGVNLGTSPLEKYAGGSVCIFISIGGTTGINNPALADGSHNTIITKISTTTAIINATGPDAVAIVKEGA